jgi:hypothetical protein
MRIVPSLVLVLLAACHGAPQAQGNLEQLVKTCQTKTGTNFTYTDDTARLLREHAFRLEGTEPRSSEEWLAALRTALAEQKLELARIGPEHLEVWLVRPIPKGG